MVDNAILRFDPKRDPGESRYTKYNLPTAVSNPYDPVQSPPDILNFLPPDGSKFGLFSDPYARMVYYQPKQGNHTGKYWLTTRLEEHSFTEHEIKLINFLAHHRCATRSQITRAVFSIEDKEHKIKDFIQRCRSRGIIAAFSWITPCQDGRKKPLIYGLTRIGVQAAEHLFHIKIPKEYQFQPVDFPMMAGPKMNTFFHNLVANELYAELVRLDRVIHWERSPFIRLTDGTHHRPDFVTELIKDVGEIMTFWIETIRLTDEWYEYTVNRFKQTQFALDKLPDNMKPKRIIVLADSDSRVPILAKLAEEYLPDAVIRFTTDERLASGLNRETFLVCDPVKNDIVISTISFLTEGAPGMKAADYFATHQGPIEDEDEFEE